jgi:hypothetical protein
LLRGRMLLGRLHRIEGSMMRCWLMDRVVMDRLLKVPQVLRKEAGVRDGSVSESRVFSGT